MDTVYQALITVGVIFVLVPVVFLLLLLLLRHTPKPQKHPQFQTLTLTHPSTKPPSPSSSSSASADEEISSFDPSLDQISISDLAAATNNFSADAIVGDGGFGFVYRARLPNGLTVAVKKLSSDAAFHGLREFRAEIETLAQIRHPNLARILGFSISGPDRILIYEFLEHGSLDQWIHDPDPEKTPPLPWHARARVIHGVARGLAFLHEECKPRIIHRDIKASNVLLDSDFGARIADFGLARHVGPEMTHVSTQVAGTMGYLPPEYRAGLTTATVKGDVYSFGVLLYEVASGRRPSWPVKGGDGKEVSMVRWARGMVESGLGLEVLDPLMMGGGEGLEAKGYLNVAYKCTDENAKMRPSMKEAVAALDVYMSKEA